MDRWTDQYGALLLDRELIGHFVCTDDVSGLGRDCLLLLFGVNRSPQSDGATLRDDLDVVCVRRERAVVMDRLPDLLRNLPVGSVVLLLISSGVVGLVPGGVIGCGG